MRGRSRLRLILFFAVAGGSIAIAATAYGIGFFDDFEQQTVDTRFSIRGDRSPPKNLVVVKVDDVTFSDLNVRWPFPRSFHARLLDRIRAGDPKAVAFDIQFSEYTTPAQDNALAYALARAHGKVALATTEVTKNGVPNLIFDPAALKQLGARAGNSNFATSKGDVIRKMPYQVNGLKSFAITAAEIASGKTITRRQMGGGSQWIDFAGKPGTITSYSYSRVLRGQVPPSAFTDKIVVIGASAPSLQDIHPTSTGPLMPGPEIQANAIDTALHGFPLRSLDTVWNVLLIVGLGLVVPLVSLRAGPSISVTAGLLSGGLFTVGTQLAFQHGRIVSFVYPLTALALSSVGSLGTHYTLEAFEKERVRDVFSRFVPEQVVDQVLAQTGEDLRLGGEEVVATVMFSDLRGFTTSAEDMPAKSVIHVLNHYLHEMSEAILAHGGTLICYMGDGIYAIFGAPLEQEDHADRAMTAAREMLTVRLPAFNRWMSDQGLGEGYVMGIGLNTGPVMTGNVGHERRMDYTAVGDIVNTASRIEGMTKGTPYSVLIAESTHQLLQAPTTDLVYYEELEVRGRQAKLKLWALDIKKPEHGTDLGPGPAKPAEAPAPVRGA